MGASPNSSGSPITQTIAPAAHQTRPAMSISWFFGMWATRTLRTLLVRWFHDPDAIGEPARPPDDVPTVTPHPGQPRQPVARLYPSTVGARPTPPQAVLGSTV